MPIKLFPCEKNGKHVVKDIHEILPSNDPGDKILVKRGGYKYRATCIYCSGSIVAKDKKEYEI